MGKSILSDILLFVGEASRICLAWQEGMIYDLQGGQRLHLGYGAVFELKIEFDVYSK